MKIFVITFLLVVSGCSNLTDPTSHLLDANEKSRQNFDELVQSTLIYWDSHISNAGGKLRIDSDWESSVLNGYAKREGNDWILEVPGGFYRHSATTSDGFLALLCHEIGHHLGGAPFKPNISWMSQEGQADYFAASYCLPKMWERADNASFQQKTEVSQSLRALCEVKFENRGMADLCVRIGMAGFSFVEINRIEHGYASETSSVDFGTPSSVIAAIPMTYPRAQCRLDTFLAGAIGNPRPRCWFIP
jgi:hypothetical protein